MKLMKILIFHLSKMVTENTNMNIVELTFVQNSQAINLPNNKQYGICLIEYNCALQIFF